MWPSTLGLCWHWWSTSSRYLQLVPGSWTHILTLELYHQARWPLLLKLLSSPLLCRCRKSVTVHQPMISPIIHGCHSLDSAAHFTVQSESSAPGPNLNRAQRILNRCNVVQHHCRSAVAVCSSTECNRSRVSNIQAGDHWGSVKESQGGHQQNPFKNILFLFPYFIITHWTYRWAKPFSVWHDIIDPVGFTWCYFEYYWHGCLYWRVRLQK